MAQTGSELIAHRVETGTARQGPRKQQTVPRGAQASTSSKTRQPHTARMVHGQALGPRRDKTALSCSAGLLTRRQNGQVSYS